MYEDATADDSVVVVINRTVSLFRQVIIVRIFLETVKTKSAPKRVENKHKIKCFNVKGVEARFDGLHGVRSRAPSAHVVVCIIHVYIFIHTCGSRELVYSILECDDCSFNCILYEHTHTHTHTQTFSTYKK